jgi:hypothetical protein
MEMSSQLHAPAALPTGIGDLIGGWVGPRAGLDAVVKRNSHLLPGLESPISQPVTQNYTTELFRFLCADLLARNTYGIQMTQ